MIKEEYHYPYKFFYLYLAVVILFAALFYFIIDLVWIRWTIFLVAAALVVMKIFKNKSIF